MADIIESRVAVGKVFGHLTIIRSAPRQNHARALCRCECGTEKEIRVDDLRRGHIGSCGCLWHKPKHGMRGTRTYRAWANMLTRCQPNGKDRHCYYDRGIHVCPDWTGSGGFERFYTNMGDCPPGLTLDRIDNDLGYFPSNCRWQTRKVQTSNTRRVKWIDLPDGRRMILKDACQTAGVKLSTLLPRVHRSGLSHQYVFNQLCQKKTA